MKKTLYLIGVFALIPFIACESKQSQPTEVTPKSSFQAVYQLSEMAQLMEDMYTDLERIRPDIIENKPIGTLPINLIKIHTAEMTNTFERTYEFERFAKLLIETQKQLFDAEPHQNRIILYNNVVMTCLACHKSPAGCDGPIPRIQGLMIK